MLPPNELKNKNFSRAIRGYATAEVDEHIDFLIAQYTELYRENDELERKYRVALAELEKFRGDEASIRSALVNAQRAGAKITRDATERSEIVLRSAKANCDRILSEFHEKIRQERDTLTKLQEASHSFRAMLVSQYGEQIRRIEELSDVPEGDDIPDDAYIRSIIASIKADVTRISEEMEAEGKEAEALALSEADPAVTEEPLPDEMLPKKSAASEEEEAVLPPELAGLISSPAEKTDNTDQVTTD